MNSESVHHGDIKDREDRWKKKRKRGGGWEGEEQAAAMEEPTQRHLRKPSSQVNSTEPEGAAQSPVLKKCLYFGRWHNPLEHYGAGNTIPVLQVTHAHWQNRNSIYSAERPYLTSSKQSFPGSFQMDTLNTPKVLFRKKIGSSRPKQLSPQHLLLSFQIFEPASIVPSLFTEQEEMVPCASLQ